MGPREPEGPKTALSKTEIKGTSRGHFEHMFEPQALFKNKPRTKQLVVRTACKV